MRFIVEKELPELPKGTILETDKIGNYVSDTITIKRDTLMDRKWFREIKSRPKVRNTEDAELVSLCETYLDQYEGIKDTPVNLNDIAYAALNMIFGEGQWQAYIKSIQNCEGDILLLPE